MNVQFYVARFDEASWQLLANFGLTGSFLRDNHRGMAALEQHIYYKRELLAGALIRIASELEEVKPKVVRFTHRMYDVETGEEVASTTLTAAHVDTDARRAVPFPDDVAARLGRGARTMNARRASARRADPGRRPALDRARDHRGRERVGGGREPARALAPHRRPRARRRHHRHPGRGQVDADRRAARRTPRAAAAASAWSRSTRRARSPAARCSATASAWASTATTTGVFIRSVASRGHLGGVSRATGRIVDVLDAAGFDPIIVETVGTGQSEVEMRELADTRIVVCAPGLGDDIQAIKAGVLEIADILVVNRGDSPLAADTERSLREMLRLRRRGPWEVAVVRTTATTGEGVAALADAIEAHAAFAGRGRRLRAQAPATIDDVAAVDRAITTRRSVRAFLPAPGPARDRRADPRRRAAAPRAAPTPSRGRSTSLAGAAKARLTRAIAAAFDAGASTREFHYYPTKWFEPYLARRRKIGWDLYGLLGIGRGDKDKSHAQHRRNYVFFDAPVGLVFTIDRNLETGSWLDYGMFLENVMVAARAPRARHLPAGGVDGVPAADRAKLGLPENEQVVCGMALGYADPDAIENRLVTEREPVAGFAQVRRLRRRRRRPWLASCRSAPPRCATA